MALKKNIVDTTLAMSKVSYYLDLVFGAYIIHKFFFICRISTFRATFLWLMVRVEARHPKTSGRTFGKPNPKPS